MMSAQVEPSGRPSLAVSCANCAESCEMFSIVNIIALHVIFVNSLVLFGSYLVTLLKTTDLMKQDAVCNELVLNLRVADDAVSVIKLNPPYNLKVDLSKISTGRGERT